MIYGHITFGASGKQGQEAKENTHNFSWKKGDEGARPVLSVDGKEYQASRAEPKRRGFKEVYEIEGNEDFVLVLPIDTPKSLDEESDCYNITGSLEYRAFGNDCALVEKASELGEGLTDSAEAVKMLLARCVMFE